MPGAHGDGDARACGATTIVTGQSTVFIDKKLWAVEGDLNSHGGGALIPTGQTVFAEGKKVIVNFADGASADGLCPTLGGAHCNPLTAFGSFDSFAYGPGGSGGDISPAIMEWQGSALIPISSDLGADVRIVGEVFQWPITALLVNTSTLRAATWMKYSSWPIPISIASTLQAITLTKYNSWPIPISIASSLSTSAEIVGEIFQWPATALLVNSYTLQAITLMNYNSWPIPISIASSLSASAGVAGAVYQWPATALLYGDVSVAATSNIIYQWPATALLYGDVSVAATAKILLERLDATLSIESVIAANTTLVTVPTFLAALQDLGLTNGLMLCLDAGDIASYDPTSQTAKWLDTSGNGYDFYRGSSSVGDAAQPTFNGTPGARASSDYWSFDGGDDFLYDSANETWMESLHKNNALFSFCGWMRFPSVSSLQSFFGDSHTDSIGVNFYYDDATTNFVFQVYNTNTDVVYTLQLDATMPTNTWFFLSLVVNEPAGTGFIGLNTTYGTTNASYSSPSSANADYTLKIGSDGSDGGRLSSGARMAMASFWSGVGLSQANMTAIRNATNRFGV